MRWWDKLVRTAEWSNFEQGLKDTGTNIYTRSSTKIRIISGTTSSGSDPSTRRQWATLGSCALWTWALIAPGINNTTWCEEMRWWDKLVRTAEWSNFQQGLKDTSTRIRIISGTTSSGSNKYNLKRKREEDGGKGKSTAAVGRWSVVNQPVLRCASPVWAPRKLVGTAVFGRRIPSRYPFLFLILFLGHVSYRLRVFSSAFLKENARANEVQQQQPIGSRGQTHLCYGSPA